MNPLRKHLRRLPIPRTFAPSDFIGIAAILVIVVGMLGLGG